MAAYMRTVFHFHRCLPRSLSSHPCALTTVTRRCTSSSTVEKSGDGTSYSEAPVSISDSCVKQLHKLGEKNKFLRITVEGGGCSGFQCLFNLDETLIKEEDRVIERDGVKVVVDDISLQYIKGATIDYHEELIRSAFRVTNIPMAEKGCSCGASFSLKI
ncbi:iron-sulfur cluster assembly 2 homolog, mitochondrial-like [Amphiura filiformis]|uniref:iron-sulfur cluster assembly 2 homolog, mitochondrial-like n=1 Tax=Amphiura filiformis TaxID=82378 RepID=UPI003B222ACB